MPTLPEIGSSLLWRVAVALVAWVAIGCSAPAATGVGRDTLRAVRLDGVEWRVIVAPPDGMRGRDGFGGADGMLFDLGREVEPGAVVFVMDGVAFPLDVAWFAGDGTLVGVATMPRCPAEPCPRHAPERPYRWAVEAPVGAFDRLAPDARLDVPG